MQAALDEFRQNIVRCKETLRIHALLTGGLATGLDVSDLLRFAVASAVSSVDRYVHYVVELGMTETQLGLRAQTDSYRAFQVAMAGVHDAMAVPPIPDWFVAQIRSQHERKTFQKSDKIHAAVQLIKAIDIWAQIAAVLGVTAANLRLDYDLFVTRRNAIVHQADIDITNPGFSITIAEPTATTAVALVENIIEAMHPLIV